jgi:hypothetical protein
MSRPSIFARFTDNALASAGAAVAVSPAVMDTYDKDTLLTHRPSARVRWDLPSPNAVSLHFTWTTAQELALLVLPVINADDGTITFTTTSGFNQTIPNPTMRGSGMSRTLAVRLAGLDSDLARRTTNDCTLTVSGPSADLILGGFVGLYGPERTFVDRDFQWGFRKNPIGYQAEHENAFGTDLVSSYQTQAAVYTLTAPASEDDRTVIDDWLEANFVSGYPVFIWVDPDGRNLPLVCRVLGQPEIIDVYSPDAGSPPSSNRGLIQLSLTVKELAKGEPIA